MDESGLASDPAWLDEIDLDPSGGWLRMGTRALGDRPWLIVDERRESELALKARLRADRHAEVFAAQPATEAAGRRVLRLVTDELDRRGLSSEPLAGHAAEPLHPLDAAGALVQEDLCIVARRANGWVLVAASLCFPSRWRLTEKLGQDLTAVHAPVEGYRRELASRVDHLFDRVGDRVVWRRNWFIHPDPALHQPDRPVGGDPVVAADRCLTDLHLRSERQTIRRLDPGHALFTIRIQHEPLQRFATSTRRVADLQRYLTDADDRTASHRGLGEEQRIELGRRLDRLTSSSP